MLKQKPDYNKLMEKYMEYSRHLISPSRCATYVKNDSGEEYYNQISIDEYVQELSNDNKLESIDYNLESIGYNLESIGYNVESIGYNLESIGYNLESMGYKLERKGYNNEK